MGLVSHRHSLTARARKSTAAPPTTVAGGGGRTSSSGKTATWTRLRRLLASSPPTLTARLKPTRAGLSVGAASWATTRTTLSATLPSRVLAPVTTPLLAPPEPDPRRSRPAAAVQSSSTSATCGNPGRHLPPRLVATPPLSPAQRRARRWLPLPRSPSPPQAARGTSRHARTRTTLTMAAAVSHTPAAGRIVANYHQACAIIVQVGAVGNLEVCTVT